MAVEPAAGRRQVWVRRRAKPDFTRVVCELVRRYPRARPVHVVLDNLNTHTAQALAEAVGTARAAQVLKRLVWHFTPKHASWLNMAEIEISVLTKQCLGRRLNTMERVASEASIWARQRNRRRIPIHWTFRHADARRLFRELIRKKFAG
jgi:transposase